jgi:hypothetical protein
MAIDGRLEGRKEIKKKESGQREGVVDAIELLYGH